MIDVLDKGFVELIDMMGDEQSVVRAARVSLANDTTEYPKERDDVLIRYMLQNKHTSPFEHIVFTFHIKCPLFVRSQIQRHRTFSYNEISRRYTSDEIEFYYPTSIRGQAENNRQASVDSWEQKTFVREADLLSAIKGTTEICYVEYLNLLDLGVSREQARMILPQNLYTRFYMTGNLHNWFSFLDLRDSEHAQYETRLYAQAIKGLIKERIPNIMDIWENVK